MSRRKQSNPRQIKPDLHHIPHPPFYPQTTPPSPTPGDAEGGVVSIATFVPRRIWMIEGVAASPMFMVDALGAAPGPSVADISCQMSLLN
ncbi:unnamed protein product [Boreogadus saida]